MLSYSPYGEAPILAVRLQELFGMLDTPSINSATQTVVIHLLSPGYKPVQVTTDLSSFWQNTYFEVRKEFKRRYPKHSWPEPPPVWRKYAALTCEWRTYDLDQGKKMLPSTSTQRSNLGCILALKSENNLQLYNSHDRPAITEKMRSQFAGGVPCA